MLRCQARSSERPNVLRTLLTCFALVALAASMTASLLEAQDSDTIVTIWDGVYTAGQAARQGHLRSQLLPLPQLGPHRIGPRADARRRQVPRELAGRQPRSALQLHQGPNAARQRQHRE